MKNSVKVLQVYNFYFKLFLGEELQIEEEMKAAGKSGKNEFLINQHSDNPMFFPNYFDAARKRFKVTEQEF